VASVYFEPIEEEIECGDDETVLDAAFRHGFSLAYGCREGQCSACKCYLLEGEVSLKRYSSFALSDTEEAQGYTLLCRAMPDSDLVVELLHVDEDYRLDNPIREGRGTITAIEELTGDIVRLELTIGEPGDFTFQPGQYVDLRVPGEDLQRSFSTANLCADDRLEFMIKRYPGGRFSGLVGDGLDVGSELEFTGPYGGFYLRATDRPVVMIAGGSGMAPQLGLLRAMVQAGDTRRPVRFFYGARTVADLFYADEIAELGSRFDDFRYEQVLSDPDDAPWDGRTGFVHEIAGELVREDGLDDFDAYLCGPPPMIDAAMELLEDGFGIDSGQIHYDKFTTAADAADEESA
jgi:propane monooxygenase reductase subunit